MGNTTSRSIALFDSGVGGLTVAHAIKTLLPNEHLVYFGDTARVPYGPKSAETVCRYSCENTRLLMQYNPKLLVIACNTSTAYARQQVAQMFPGPVIGVVDPGARAAVEATKTKRVAVLGTRGTINSGAYQSALQALDPQLTVYACGCGLFVPIVEEQLTHHPVAELMIRHYLQPLLDQQVDTFILGCTHYPLLEEPMKTVLGNTVQLVSSAQATARQVAQVLDHQNLLASQPPAHPDLFLMSDDAPAFRHFHSQIFGACPAEFQQVS